jgi:hypothetical protein
MTLRPAHRPVSLVTPRAWWRAHRQLAADLRRAEQRADSWKTTALRRARLVDDFADDRNRATDRMRTAETLLVQLYRGADLGDPPREAGRVNIYATARAIGQALATASRAARRAPLPAQPAGPAGPGATPTAVLDLADLTMHLPGVLQPLVRGFRMAPVIAGVERWDLSRAVPSSQAPREVEYARALMRVQAEVEQMSTTRPDLAGWAHRITAAGQVPVGFTRDEVTA